MKERCSFLPCWRGPGLGPDLKKKTVAALPSPALEKFSTPQLQLRLLRFRGSRFLHPSLPWNSAWQQNGHSTPAEGKTGETRSEVYGVSRRRHTT